MKRKILTITIILSALLPVVAHGALVNRSSVEALKDNLMGYWTFDGKDVVNGVAKDVSGQGKDANLINISTSTFYTQGKIGQAFNFSRPTDYITNGSFSWPTGGPISVSLWVKTPGGGFSSAFDVGDLDIPNRLHAHIPYIDNILYWDYGDITTGRISTDFSTFLNKWTHVVLVSAGNGGTFKAIYINGVLVNSSATSDGPNVPLTGIDIGRWELFNFDFPGSMDDFRIYNRVLSTDEIRNLYNQGSGELNISPKEAIKNGLVGSWTFDGKDIVNGVVRDVTGLGNNGNLLNISTSTFYAQGKIGQAGSFDGLDDAVNAGSATVLDDLPNSGGLTASVWVNVRGYGQSGTPYLISKETNASGGSGWFFGLSSGGQIIQFVGNYNTTNLTVNTVASSFTAAADFNKWVHLAVTWDGSSTATNVHIYKNGVEVAYSTQTNGVTTYDSDAALNLRIGSGNSNSRQINAVIDEARLYNRPLSATEIRNIYNQGSGKFNVPSKEAIKNNLLGYWTFDGRDTPWTSATAGTARDLSGNNNTGTLTNMSRDTSPQSGKIGQGLKFDGANDFVSTGKPLSTFMSASDGTMSAWVYPSAVVTSSCVSGDGGNVLQDGETVGGGYVWMGYDSTSKFCFGGFDTGNKNYYSATTYAINAWHLITWAHTGGVVIGYVDGVQVVSGTLANIQLLTNNVAIGKSWSSAFFNGKIDDVRIYNRALSATEIKQLYNMGK